MTLSFAPKRSSDRTLYIIRQNFIYIFIYIYIYVCIYLFRQGKNKETMLSSLQACFVIIHSSGVFFVKNIHDHFMSWCMLALRSPYNSAIIRCNPCLKEKLFIIRQPELSSLNKRNEFVSSCRHRNKALLRTIIQSTEIYCHAHYANL